MLRLADQQADERDRRTEQLRGETGDRRELGIVLQRAEAVALAHRRALLLGQGVERWRRPGAAGKGVGDIQARPSEGVEMTDLAGELNRTNARRGNARGVSLSAVTDLRQSAGLLWHAARGFPDARYSR